MYVQKSSRAALLGLKSSHVDTHLASSRYLDGGEVDVDVVMSGGEWRYAAVTDNGPTLEPYFNEPRMAFKVLD